jgi:predicted RNase H-like HicB family nuclease
MIARRRFRVVFAGDDNDHWFVDAIDVPGAHSHGRTLDAARRNIREAIALVLEIDDEGVDLDDHVPLETSG